MASYNRVIIMGNLTRDPEYKQLSSGQTVCRLGLASNRQFKNKQTGMMVQEVCFVDVDVWGPQADSCNQYLQKGRGVLIEGRLKLDTWVDNEGQRKSKHSVVADRVTFMPAAATQEMAPEPEPVKAAEKPESEKPAEKKAAPAPGSPAPGSPAPGSPAGEVDFKDQQPFEDDLPF